jgi:thioredoxin-related protein
MRPQNRYTLLLILVSWLLMSTPVLAGGLPMIKDLKDWGAKARTEARPIVIVVVREDCPFCRLLEEEVIWPMIRSGDYLPRISLGLVDLDAGKLIRDFDGQMITADEFAARYGVWLTPTVLFLGAEGEELAEPLIGTRLIDYYWVDLDSSIDSVQQQLKDRHQ